MFVAHTCINIKRIHLKFKTYKMCLIVWLFAMWIYPTHSYNRHNECDMKVNMNLNDIVSSL